MSPRIGTSKLESGWARIAAIALSLALLGASAYGTLQAFALPLQVEQRTVTATYQQRSDFSYQAVLRPGSVYGQLALARSLTDFGTARSDKDLFVNLIDRLDLQYGYTLQGAEGGRQVDEQFSLRLRLAAPGVWQKELLLVPETDYHGPFQARAQVNFTQVRALLKTIEDETGVQAKDYEIRLLADTHVTAPGDPAVDETYHQELAATTADGLLRWETPLSASQPLNGGSLSHQGTFSYTAHFGPNMLFADPTGAPARTLPADWPLFSDALDSLAMRFDARLASIQPLADVHRTAGVTLHVEKPDAWSKDFELVPTATHDGADLSLPFSLDVNALVALIQQVDREVGGGSGDPIKLALTATVDTEATVGGKPIREHAVHTLDGTLDRTLLKWNQDELSKTEPGQIAQSTLVPNTARYLAVAAPGLPGLSAFGVRILALAALALALLFGGLVALANARVLRAGRPSPIRREEQRTRKKYADIIAGVAADPPARAEDLSVPVRTLEDLVKVAVDGNRPVLQVGVNGHSRYLVLDGGTRYIYDPAAAEQQEVRPEHIERPDLLPELILAEAPSHGNGNGNGKASGNGQPQNGRNGNGHANGNGRRQRPNKNGRK